ncbi:MAG: lysophospholipid acyltransferase family protein [Acidobacteria bacterium]|nr:lysophospholipid acyltransferase family protein [Acidobacteriota bacterium]
MKLPGWLMLPLVPRAASLAIRGLRATMSLRCSGGEVLESIRAGGRPYIHAFWHGHLLLMPYAYPGGRIAILISEHRDGEYIARTMARFGHSAIRGSTTSGGAAALRGAVRRAKDGWDIGFTPDGPRGPRHVVQMGVVLTARLSGLPIVPVSFAASGARSLGSWDGFVVPKLFSRGVFVYGSPVPVTASADEDEMRSAASRLQQALVLGTEEAQRLASDRAAFEGLRPVGPLRAAEASR